MTECAASPPTLLTLERHGFAVVEALGCVYALVGLALVVDSHLVLLMRLLMLRLSLPEDVAGAGFLAIVNAAPELIVSIASSEHHPDTAVAMVLGSCTYNLTVTVGLAALAAPSPPVLSPIALRRDCCFFGVAVLLVALIQLSSAGPAALACLLATHVAYCFSLRHRSLSQEYPAVVTVAAPVVAEHAPGRPHETNSLLGSSDAGKRRWCRGAPVAARRLREAAGALVPRLASPFHAAFALTLPDLAACLEDEQLASTEGATPPLRPTPTAAQLAWLFVGATAWIALLGWVAVAMLQRLECACSSGTSAIVGYALLSVGTNLPDTAGALVAARRGLGAMTVSACFGTNIFNLCVSLSLPWLVSHVLTGQPVRLTNRKLLAASSLALLLAVAVGGSIACHRMVLRRSLGVAFLSIYAVAMTVGTAFLV